MPRWQRNHPILIRLPMYKFSLGVVMYMTTVAFSVELKVSRPLRSEANRDPFYDVSSTRVEGRPRACVSSKKANPNSGTSKVHDFHTGRVGGL